MREKHTSVLLILVLSFCFYVCAAERSHFSESDETDDYDYISSDDDSFEEILDHDSNKLEEITGNLHLVEGDRVGENDDLTRTEETVLKTEGRIISIEGISIPKTWRNPDGMCIVKGTFSGISKFNAKSVKNLNTEVKDSWRDRYEGRVYSYIGDYPIALVMVSFKNFKFKTTKAELYDLWMNHKYSPYQVYYKSSYGKMKLTTTLKNIYTIDVNMSPEKNSCEFKKWVAAAQKKFDLRNERSILYLFPLGVSACNGRSGRGDILDFTKKSTTFGQEIYPDRSHLSSCYMWMVWAHELGHEFGLGHSNTPDREYGERNTLMGGGVGGAPFWHGTNLMNVVKRYFMGWLKPVELNEEDLCVETKECSVKNYPIGPLSMVSEEYPKAIAIHLSRKSRKGIYGDTLFLSMRDDIDDGLPDRLAWSVHVHSAFFKPKAYSNMASVLHKEMKGIERYDFGNVVLEVGEKGRVPMTDTEEPDAAAAPRGKTKLSAIRVQIRRKK